MTKPKKGSEVIKDCGVMGVVIEKLARRQGDMDVRMVLARFVSPKWVV